MQIKFKYKKTVIKKQSGAVTLIAVIMIGFIVSAIIISSSVYNRLAVLNARNIKNISQTQYSSEACVYAGLIEIYNNTSYTGSSNISDGDIDCTYTVTNEGGNLRKITTSSVINGLNYYNEVNVSLGTSIDVISFKRVTEI